MCIWWMAGLTNTGHTASTTLDAWGWGSIYNVNFLVQAQPSDLLHPKSMLVLDHTDAGFVPRY